MINKEELLNNGYECIIGSSELSDIELYKKEIKDSDGVRYIITVYVLNNEVWSFKVKLHYYNRDETIIFNDINHLTIEQIEKDFARRWLKTDAGYEEFYN